MTLGTLSLTKTDGRGFIDNAPFINCLSKINNVVIDNAADLDVIVPMYNLLKYIENYKKNNRKFVELLQG